jgi:hypothetical protein
MRSETAPTSQRHKTIWSSLLGFLTSVVSGIRARVAGLGVAASCATGGVAGVAMWLFSFFFIF